ncbi:unnamed protein product [Arabis nemorensis]|uniref:Retrotransposon gag domain-containing protein n=1 Tax=Arabis nemorensis TaxID=586526 RepID=A0A565BC31_9BRAS|nr:unnamed protein product [Arabis nemorensis]
MADLRQQMQQLVEAFNGVNIQDQPRRRGIAEVETSSDESNLNPDDFLDWLRSMEMAFKYNTYDDEKKFKNHRKRSVRFVHGLNEDIASKVELQPCWTLNDVKKLVIKVEKQNKAEKKPYTRSYNSGASFILRCLLKGR